MKASHILIGILIGLAIAAGGLLADNLPISRDTGIDFTRAPIPISGDSSTGAHFELSISGTSAAIGSAMTADQVYRIACTVDTLCEFGSAAPTADTNSSYFIGAGSFDYVNVRTTSGINNSFVACIAEDGSSSGSCYIHSMR